MLLLDVQRWEIRLSAIHSPILVTEVDAGLIPRKLTQSCRAADDAVGSSDEEEESTSDSFVGMVNRISSTPLGALQSRDPRPHFNSNTCTCLEWDWPPLNSPYLCVCLLGGEVIRGGQK